MSRILFDRKGWYVFPVSDPDKAIGRHGTLNAAEKWALKQKSSRYIARFYNGSLWSMDWYEIGFKTAKSEEFSGAR